MPVYNSAGVQDSGELDGISWSVTTDGVLTLSGTNTRQGSGKVYLPWSAYADSITKAVVSVKNATTTEGWFKDCSKLTEVTFNGFDTTNVKIMESMFEGCTSLVTVDFSGFNTANVTSMRMMFAGCENLTKLDLSSFDTSMVQYMDGMFVGCKKLEQLETSSFNTQNVITMKEMFKQCMSLTQLDLRHFNTARVLNMSCMFEDCTALKTLDVSKFDTTHVVDMNSMFASCQSLVELDLSKWKTGLVTDMHKMFYDCISLEKLDVSNFDTGYVTDMSKMFEFCWNLELLDVRGFDTSKVTNMSKMFDECYRLKRLDVSKFDTSNVTSMYRMFCWCENLQKLDVARFDTGNVTNMAEMFKGCYGVTAIDVSKFDTANAIYMMEMFFDCEKLKTLDLSNFNTSNVINMEFMFGFCYSLEELDLSSFDTRNVTNMESMFNGCYSLKEVDLSSFDTGNVIFMDEMFYGCSSVEGIDLVGFNFSKMQKVCDMFGECNNLRRIRIPVDMKVQVDMPVAQMYDLDGNVYSTYFPTDLTESIWLYRENPKISGNLYVKEIAPQTYTGKAIKPQVQVYSGNKLLQEKVDYTISYRNNTKVNDASNPKTAPTITVKGKDNYTKQDTVTFCILAKDIAADDVVAAQMIKVQNGKEQKLIPVLTYNGKKLVNKKDFTVSYPDLENAAVKDAYKAPGTYQILVTGKGNFTGERVIDFTIVDGVLMSAVKIGTIKNQTYTGEEIKPEVKVTYKGKTLTPGSDYEVSYDKNKEVGTAIVTVTGKGNYYGTKTATFKITGKSISKAKISGTSNVVFDGTEKTFALTVVLGKETLKEGTDYTVSYSNNVNAGTATVLVTGKGCYTGIAKKTFKITPFDFTNEELRYISPNSIAYLKGGAKPYFMYFRVNGVGLDEGKDYTLTYKNYNKASINLGKKKPTIVVKGIGNYKGVVEIEYTIRIKNLQDEDKPITMKAVDVAYSKSKGKYVSKPVLTDYDGKKLVAGVDYEKNPVYTLADGTVLNNKSVVAEGQVITVTVTGKGNYEGTLSTTYTVKPASINAAKVKIDTQVYTGREIKLDQDDFEVKVGKDSLTYGEDYEIVSYSNNLKKGTASVTIRGINSYGGEKTVKFKIVAKEMIWFWKLFD